MRTFEAASNARDADYCDRWSCSVGFLSVSMSVSLSGPAPCKDGCMDRGPVQNGDTWGPEEHRTDQPWSQTENEVTVTYLSQLSPRAACFRTCVMFSSWYVCCVLSVATPKGSGKCENFLGSLRSRKESVRPSRRQRKWTVEIGWLTKQFYFNCCIQWSCLPSDGVINVIIFLHRPRLSRSMFHVSWYCEIIIVWENWFRTVELTRMFRLCTVLLRNSYFNETACFGLSVHDTLFLEKWH